jgi:hypothetical protein
MLIMSSDRPKTDFLVSDENEYLARKCCKYLSNNEYSAKGSKHRKNVNLFEEKNGFLGWELQVAVDGHKLWATETYMHKTLSILSKS